METRSFGRTGRSVGVIGQGTWRLDRDSRAAAIAALRRGLDLGMDHIDTAELYGDAEMVIAEAIAGRRDEVFLVSKVVPENATRQGVIAACERSLARLRTDRLDGYLLHWPGRHPLAETVAGFESLRAAGKILWWGVSNFDVADLEELEAITGAAGGPAGVGPVTNQVLYHLGERAIEHAVIPWCEKRGVNITAYTPFGERPFPGPRSAGGRVLAEIAAAHGATRRQVALRFLVRRPSVVTIPKATQLRHVEENAGAGDLPLTDAEIARIDAAFPRGPRPKTLPTA